MIEIFEFVRSSGEDEAYEKALINPEMISHVVVERRDRTRTRISMDNGESIHTDLSVPEISALIREYYKVLGMT